MSEEPTLGWHENVSFPDYLRLQAASASTLEAMRDCPARVKQHKESSTAQALGQAIHAAVLEPFRFKADYVLEPDLAEILDDKGKPYTNPRATKKYKELVAELEAGGKRTVLTRDDYAVAWGIRQAVWQHRRAKKILEHPTCRVEVTGLFRDAQTGVLCKIRPDVRVEFEGYGVVKMNVKSARSAAPSAFQSDLYKYGYHRAEAFYEMGFEALDGRAPRDSLFLVVEKEPPFLTALYRIDEGSLDAGREQVRRTLDLYAQCLDADVWPGYPQEIIDINLPPYAWKQIDDEIGVEVPNASGIGVAA